MWLFLLGSGFSVLAQSKAEVLSPSPDAAALPDLTAAHARYAAAHDSLLRLVADVHVRSEARMGVFKVSQGTFGGPHRRVKSYAGTSSPVISYGDSQKPIALVRQQTVKRRFGVEIEKVKYYDAKGRKVLVEQFEDHQLTRMLLLEYTEQFNTPTANWLFVHGDYVVHTSRTGGARKKSSYYFMPQASPASPN